MAKKNVNTIDIEEVKDFISKCGKTNMSEVAKHFKVSTYIATKILDEMEKRGIITSSKIKMKIQGKNLVTSVRQVSLIDNTESRSFPKSHIPQKASTEKSGTTTAKPSGTLTPKAPAPEEFSSGDLGDLMKFEEVLKGLSTNLKMMTGKMSAYIEGTCSQDLHARMETLRRMARKMGAKDIETQLNSYETKVQNDIAAMMEQFRDINSIANQLEKKKIKAIKICFVDEGE
jgi:hypothetical protein